jgi:imidazoleglycerol-phosphate dehydratase
MRTAHVSRQTSETQIDLKLTIDGTGTAELNTNIPFFDHMLTLFAKHSLMDLTLTLKGDIDIDYHHSVEDAGICLGKAFKEALGDAKGITRYADVVLPMDETLCQMAIDISGRSYLAFDVPFQADKIGQFDTELVQEFFNAFVSHAGVTLHVKLLAGTNAHHVSEACFKALAVVLLRATTIDPRKANQIPSTKGML